MSSSDDSGRNTTLTHTYIVAGPPQIQISSPADGATYTLGSTTLTTYSCSSPWGVQIVTCAGTAANGNAFDTGSVGAKTFTVHASDGLGATAALTRTYTVVYSFSGFDPPVTTTGSIDAAKAGDTLPLRFSLHGDNGLSIVTQTTWEPASCTDWSSTTATTPRKAHLQPLDRVEFPRFGGQGLIRRLALHARWGG